MDTMLTKYIFEIIKFFFRKTQEKIIFLGEVKLEGGVLIILKQCNSEFFLSCGVAAQRRP